MLLRSCIRPHRTYCNCCGMMASPVMGKVIHGALGICAVASISAVNGMVASRLWRLGDAAGYHLLLQSCVNTSDLWLLAARVAALIYVHHALQACCCPLDETSSETISNRSGAFQHELSAALLCFCRMQLSISPACVTGIICKSSPGRCERRDLRCASHAPACANQ